ncbi:MAG: glycosyltransferase family 4 protein [Patescibacteria group bacterium]|nr:glycosyltransferase family 4 protein [Patescibacteria group bacterium]
MQLVISIYDSLGNPYYAGGGPVVLQHVARRLSARYSVTVLTGAYPGAQDREEQGITYRHIGLPDRISSLTSFQFLLPYYARTLSYDLWLESFTPPFSTAFLPLVTRKPVVGLAHILSGPIMAAKYHLPFDWYERAGLRLYRQVIVPTPEVAEGIRNANPQAEVTVIPNGVDTIDFSPLPPPERYILFLGRIDWRQKGLDMLVKAYALVKDGIEAKLYIAGHGTEAEETYLRDLIHRNGLRDRIVLKGRVDGDTKLALLANAEFVAIPSRYEGMSLVALEAFSFRKPVVCFDVPGFRWIEHDGPVLKAKPFHLHDYAQLMLVLTTDPDRRERMGREAGELVRDYSWERTTAAYEDVISACLQRTECG